MARTPASIAAFPLAGLIPSDPRRMVFFGLALTATERRELANALRRSNAAAVYQDIQKGLQRGAAIGKVLERINHRQALEIQARYATAERREALRAQLRDDLLVRPTTAPKARWAPKPG